jgi:hypothetical protein
MSQAVLATSTPGTTIPARQRRRRQIKSLMRVSLVSLCFFFIFWRKTLSKVSSGDEFKKSVSVLGNNHGDARAADDEDDLSRRVETKRKNTQRSAPTRVFFEETMRSNSSTAFFDAFFHKALADVDEFQGFNVSKATLASIANRSGGKISLYVLKRRAIGDGKFEWNHVAGRSEFWSTRDFHAYVGEHVDAIAKNLREDFVEAYFLINNYDEPQSMGKRCVDIDRLRKLHPNVGKGVVSPSDRAPVWSMSKVRGCHTDILFPFPDYFSHLRETKIVRDANVPPWSERPSDDIAFRGSTTGFGDAASNLRARTLSALIDEPGFDVGLTVAIQGFQKVWAPHLFKNAMKAEDFCKFKFLMDIDGNAHSFNRQLLIAQSKAVMVRVNVFTDWIADGVMDKEFCYTIDPSDVLRSAREVRRNLLGDLERAERVANTYHRLTRWLLRDEIVVRYLRDAFTRYISSVRFVQ